MIAHRRPPARADTWKWWVSGIALFAGAQLTLRLVGAPAPSLLAGVIAGAAVALTGHRPLSLPRPVRTAALAVVGVAAGSAVQADVIATALHHPWAVLGGSAGTLALTLAAGQLLRLSGSVSAATAALASIAGGASGLTVMARDLDADEGIVAAAQYLRVVTVIMTVPVVAPLLRADVTTAAAPPPAQWWGWPGLWAGAALTVGLVLTRWLTFPAAALLLPLVAAAGLAWSGLLPAGAVPSWLLDATSAVIGLMVGLNLTRDTMRRIGGVLPAAAAMVAISVGGCAALGIGLSTAMGVSPFSGYLAFTPGGLPAVTALAVGGDADAAFVVSCQVIRLVLALCAATALGAVLRRSAARTRSRSPGPNQPPAQR